MLPNPALNRPGSPDLVLPSRNTVVLGEGSSARSPIKFLRTARPLFHGNETARPGNRLGMTQQHKVLLLLDQANSCLKIGNQFLDRFRITSGGVFLLARPWFHSASRHQGTHYKHQEHLPLSGGYHLPTPSDSERHRGAKESPRGIQHVDADCLRMREEPGIWVSFISYRFVSERVLSRCHL